MSIDKMQDVFPLIFDFKKGEQPSAEKLTKWAQLTDLAIERVTEAIGDPWDYRPHSDSSDNRYYLSIENLAQINLARFAGPSSLVSPGGNAISQSLTEPMQITLSKDRNTWSIGFPLCRSNTAGSVASSTENSDYLKAAVLANINFVDQATLNPAPEFAVGQIQANVEDISVAGDYHIEWRTGVVTSFSIPSAPVLMNIPVDVELQFFGSGAPWTTHNVIPDWKDSTEGVTVEYVSDVAGDYVYDITLPYIDGLPRVNNGSTLPGSPEVRVTPGAGTSSQYRMPYVLNALGEGEAIPEGFVRLWDNDTASIVKLVNFYTGSSPNELTTLRINCPQLPGVNTGPNSSRYRIITMGSSLSETLGYLAAVVRNNTHTGISNKLDGAIANTLAYTPPIKHGSLSERYGITAAAPTSDSSYINKLNFIESIYPTNDHPQYLHRGGFMSDDTVNSKNAMRGHLAFSSVDDFNINTTGTDAGILTRTYGVTFGGGEQISGASYAGPPRITWEGGENLTPETTVGDPANRLGFGINGIGLKHGQSSNFWGALTYTPYSTAPLYLRGHATGTTSTYGAGASLAFDYGQNAELNYVNLRTVISIGYNDPHKAVQLPATFGQVDFGTPLPFTPSADGKLTRQQMREFRFRAVPHVSYALNNAGYVKNDATPIPEMDKYFVGPGIVGADFVNVYSNAIFFSDHGDGEKTSLHTMGNDYWLDPTTNATKKPVGLYYEPDGIRSRFSLSPGNGVVSRSVFRAGYTTHNYIINQSSTDGTLEGTGFYGDFGFTGPRSAIVLETTLTGPGGTATRGDISIYARKNVDILGVEELTLHSTIGSVTVQAETELTLASTIDSVTVQAETELTLASGNITQIHSDNGVFIYSNYTGPIAGRGKFTMPHLGGIDITAADGETVTIEGNRFEVEVDTTMTFTSNGSAGIFFNAPDANQQISLQAENIALLGIPVQNTDSGVPAGYLWVDSDDGYTVKVSQDF